VLRSSIESVPPFRLVLSWALGVVSITGSLILIFTDGVDTSVSWTHHAGLSAAPLLLVAGALVAMSVAQPPTGRAAVLRGLTVAAFASWGWSQLLPNTGSGTILDDIAILLFVIDAGVYVIYDSWRLLRRSALVSQAAEEGSSQQAGDPESHRVS